MRNALLGLLFISSLSVAAPPILISDEDFGDDWPFVPKKMQLQCLPDKVIVVTNPETGRMYGLKSVAIGKARRLGLPLEQVWADNPKTQGEKARMGPVIEAGTKLCL